MKNAKKIINIIVATLFTVYMLWSGISLLRLHRQLSESERELGQYRNAVTKLNEQQQRADQSIRTIRNILQNSQQSIESSGNSVADLRNEIAEMENCYNSLWQYINSINNNNSVSNSQ